MASLAITGQARGSQAVAATSERAVAVGASGGAGEVCAAKTQKMVVAITGSTGNGGRTSKTTGLGSTGSTELGTTGHGCVGTTGLGMPATHTDISGGSATLDASLVRHETDPVAGMMLAGVVYGHQSLRCILLRFRGRFAQQQSLFKKVCKVPSRIITEELRF